MSTHQDVEAKGAAPGGAKKEELTVGRNGVAIARPKTSGQHYRTYEIFQRMRPEQTTAKMRPNRVISEEYLTDPYAVVETLRENYPCYRDWITNSFWVTQYNDVTSVFVDDANYETRSKLWFYGEEDFGRDLREELPVLEAWAKGMDDNAAPVAEMLADEMLANGEADLALDFAARYPLELLARILDLPEGDKAEFWQRYWAMQRGIHWEPNSQEAGLQAMNDLAAYFQPLLDARRDNPGEDMISAIAGLELEGGPATGKDVVVTLLEADHETLHGGLANMWFQLLTNSAELDVLKEDRRFVKFAWFETLRHSTPVIAARRFAKHEVERFGVLLPEGGMVMCSAAAANRDPRIYKDPDRFDVKRKDMCQREPRGMYRADGLPAGIAVGMGPPTKHPAVPEDRPRSVYAITRDSAVTASNILLDKIPGLRLKDGAEPSLRSLRNGEMHTCWSLPIVWD